MAVDDKKSGSDSTSSEEDVSSEAIQYARKSRHPVVKVLRFLNPFAVNDPPPVPDVPEMTPEARANFISKLYFWWMNDLMKTGYARPLEDNDVPLVEPNRTAKVMTEKFLANLEKHKQKGHKKNLVVRAINDTFFFDVWYAFFCRCCVDGLQMSTPQLSRRIIYYVADAYMGRPAHVGHGIGLVIGLTAMVVVASILQQQYFYSASRVGSHARTTLINALYRKSLVLSNKARLEYTNGKITNLMSTDTYRVEFAAMFFHFLTDSPIPIVLCIVFLLVNIGYPALCGIAMLIIAAPILGRVTRIIARRRVRSTVFTDQRIRLMQELLTSMRIIKFFAWEPAYLDRLSKIRFSEIKLVRFLLVLRSGLFAVSMTVPIFASMLAFVVLSVTGHALDPAKVFASLSLFNMLRMPLMVIPVGLSTATDAYVALQRIEKMLLEEEITGIVVADDTLDDAIEVTNASFEWDEDPESFRKRLEEEKKNAGKKPQFGARPGFGPGGRGPGGRGPPGQQKKKDRKFLSFLSRRSKPKSDPMKEKDEKENQLSRVISVESAHAVGVDASPEVELANIESVEEDDADDDFQFTGLHNLNFTIKKGELIVIAGFIGSGKTSLLASLVGEMKQTGGTVRLGGKVAYCPQPWIMNATLRDNILFGREFDPERYNKVVADCALEHDISVLPAGDMTEIGERGINISGGQKSRISLARAAYFDSDIIILDDVLSAVDPHVGRHLVDDCICGLLDGKTRLLATHQLHVLPRADRIIFMDGKGGLTIGTYDELMTSCPKFAQLTKFGSSQQNKKSEDQEVEEEDIIIKEKPGVAARANGIAGKGGKLMKAEERQTDSVSLKVYKAYYAAAGGKYLSWGVAPLIVLMAGCVTGLQIVTNLWLSFWTADRFHESKGFYIGLYVCIGLLSAIGFFMLGWATTWAGSRASVTMNLAATNKVMRAPMSFFDTNPIGRIINRFSNDVESMDNTLTDANRLFLIGITGIIGILVLIIAYLYWFAVALVPLLILYYYATAYYRASAVEIKRLDSNARSTVFSHFSETLTGLTSVRAYNEQERFVNRMETQLDYMNRFSYVILGNQRWLSVRLESVAVTLVFVTGILAVVARFNVSPSSIGLVLSYCTTLSLQMAMVIKQLADVENHMNAAERVHYYITELPSEAPYEIPEAKPRPTWPEKGAIEMQNVFLKYRPELPYVLKGITLSIKGGEKVGICGRTGAGKSSIMAALYRLSEISEGKFFIDGVDISSIGLHDLRTKLAIIPQDPVLFKGTIRSNLDPFNSYTDSQLWDALRRSGLLNDQSASPRSSEPQGLGKFHLDSTVDDEGLNFSLGERQLLALARALVRQFQILVLDEATSSVDYQTDAQIQQIIVREFSHCTILCIAHRLKTIINYDKILVLDAGTVAEFDTPWNLFKDESSIFRSLCEKSSIGDADFVRKE
ncbi:P-loop containing nucleoside triphosphate hydrolase protein [Lipomyces orientalis]|uniref:P-loop containing nucleoside triphosphate hydrolase protein n=1 Tax=Lipomyces orientalis TaxID=1233043 RepID=A0ACC3TWD1_9ASCO